VRVEAVDGEGGSDSVKVTVKVTGDESPVVTLWSGCGRRGLGGLWCQRRSLPGIGPGEVGLDALSPGVHGLDLVSVPGLRLDGVIRVACAVGAHVGVQDAELARLVGGGIPSRDNVVSDAGVARVVQLSVTEL
jgi:hypothetical protein